MPMAIDTPTGESILPSASELPAASQGLSASHDFHHYQQDTSQDRRQARGYPVTALPHLPVLATWFSHVWRKGRGPGVCDWNGKPMTLLDRIPFDRRLELNHTRGYKFGRSTVQVAEAKFDDYFEFYCTGLSWQDREKMCRSFWNGVDAGRNSLHAK